MASGRWESARSARLVGLFGLLVVMAVLFAACGQEEEESGGEGEDAGTEEGGEQAPEEGEEQASAGGETLTIYSGRNAELVGPIIDEFQEESEVDVQVRYGDTAELAATILEEGENSPADIFFAQDAGALGAVQQEGMFEALPEGSLGQVEDRFRSTEDEWVGMSGRARVIGYNVESVDPAEIPDSILEFAEPEWEGRIGWPPTNGSFQAFVTTLRLTEGEDVAREWLEGVQANDPAVYENNTATMEGIASGEVDVGFVNHYYLGRFLEEQGEGFGARNYYPEGGDAGAMINIAGAGILNTSDNQEEAEAFVEYMLSEEAQEYFAEETFEYPLAQGVEAGEELPSLEEIDTPDVDLSDLEDLEGTLDLMQETGVL